MSHLASLFLIFALLFATTHAQNQESVASCLLVPTVSHTGARGEVNTQNLPPYPKRVTLDKTHLGRLHIFSTPNEIRGQLPSALPVDAQHPRAFHIHEFGDLRTNTSEGEHYVGSGSDAAAWHDLPPHLPRHIGDMGNLKSSKVDIRNENGAPRLLFSLDGAPETDVIGRSMVIHEKVDQGASAQPSGASGPRLYHCVIGIAQKENNKARASPASGNVAIADLYSSVDGVSWDKLYGRAVFERTPQGKINVEVRTCGLNRLRSTTPFRVDVHQFGDLTGDAIASNVGPVLADISSSEENTQNPMGMLGEIKSTGPRGVFTGELQNVDFVDFLGRGIVVKQSPERDSNESQNVLVGVLGIANTNAADDIWTAMQCFSSA